MMPLTMFIKMKCDVETSFKSDFVEQQDMEAFKAANY